MPATVTDAVSSQPLRRKSESSDFLFGAYQGKLTKPFNAFVGGKYTMPKIKHLRRLSTLLDGSLFFPGPPFALTALSRIMAKTAKNIEKKSLFVSFLTDLAGFAPYHSAIWKSGKAVLRVAGSRRPLTPTERTRNLTGRMDAQRPAFDGFR
ncbi:MAG: hypothetical protein OXU71_02165 [Gammaproteobacteria bacterium]|nr:hypothetical protein [Gammaproteobacteria bacterium]